VPSGVHRESTRLAIVEQAIADTLERLQDLVPGPRARELRAKAEGYERALRAWMVRPPSEEQRAALLKLVLELNVEAMALGRDGKKEA
jgi:phosphoenolpyruvate carboxylase